MKRDNSYDVAVRDLDYIKARARAGKEARELGGTIEHAAIGACPILPGSGVREMPACPDYSMEYLCANYATTVMTFRALAAGAVTTITFNPLDGFFCPVAVAGTVRDTADPTLVRTAWVFNVNIRGCLQLDWQNATETVAAATAWMDIQSDWDPFARSGCACPVDWGCFTNTGQSQAQLQVVVGNPHAAPITGKITLFGIPWNCCPGFVDDINEGRRIRKRSGGAIAPLGTAKRTPLFGNGSAA